VRAETLALRESDFVRAARAAGASPLRVALRHVLPHLLPPVAVRATFDVGAAILSVAGLSFIGFGAQPPAPEWGALVSEGRAWLATHPQVAAAPGVALLVTVLSANLLGDGLRDALDPRAARRSG
jgi:peptide/nickel transport system permease protein